LGTWGDVNQVYLEKEGGCQHCNYTSKSKRVAIAEVVLCDEVLMDDFVNHGTSVARKNYRARVDSDRPLLEQALHLVFAGEVDPRAVEKTVDLISSNPASSMPYGLVV
jgi:type II secretory ATPase GspE/PulE/Tfp pilus assembly ATPase PilB-like protein